MDCINRWMTVAVTLLVLPAGALAQETANTNEGGQTATTVTEEAQEPSDPLFLSSLVGTVFGSAGFLVGAGSTLFLVNALANDTSSGGAIDMSASGAVTLGFVGADLAFPLGVHLADGRGKLLWAYIPPAIAAAASITVLAVSGDDRRAAAWTAGIGSVLGLVGSVVAYQMSIPKGAETTQEATTDTAMWFGARPSPSGKGGTLQLGGLF